MRDRVPSSADDVDALRIDPHHPRAHAAAPRRGVAELGGRLPRELVAERRPAAPCPRRAGGPSTDAGSNVAVLALQAAHGQLADLTRQLDAGGTGADDHDREQLRPHLGVGGRLGHLERAEDPPAQLAGVVDRLHARREAGELVVTEVRLRHPGGDDEAVVGQLDARAAVGTW